MVYFLTGDIIGFTGNQSQRNWFPDVTAGGIRTARLMVSPAVPLPFPAVAANS